MKNYNYKRTLSGIIALTRWKEHLPFSIPLTLLGILLAHKIDNNTIDYRSLLVLLANLMAVTYAFAINDISDAKDDLFISSKSVRNPISNKTISKKLGLFISIIFLGMALLLFIKLGGLPLYIGIFMLFLSHFYSSKPFRFKALPMIDLISHSLMLSGLILMTAFFTYSSNFGKIWIVFAAVTIFSIYSALYNQLRDYDADKKASLKNTSQILGRYYANILLYLVLAVSIFLFILFALSGLFPYWIPIIFLFSFLITKNFGRKYDPRGTKVINISGSLQVPLLLSANIAIISWFILTIINQLS